MKNLFFGLLILVSTSSLAEPCGKIKTLEVSSAERSTDTRESANVVIIKSDGTLFELEINGASPVNALIAAKTSDKAVCLVGKSIVGLKD